jgi:hypothetical protein
MKQTEGNVSREPSPPKDGVNRGLQRADTSPPLRTLNGFRRASRAHGVGQTGESAPTKFITPVSPGRNTIQRPRRLTSVKGTTKQIRSEAAATPAVNDDRKDLTPGPELDKRRSLIITELQSTENTYISTLEQLVSNYIKPIREYCDLNKKAVPQYFLDTVITLFNKVEIILSLNVKFRDALSDVVANWTSTTLIGKILENFFPFLKLYTDYSNSYDPALKGIESVSKEPWFAQYAAQRLELESYLITPIQRIPRYSLLLDALWKHTPTTHEDSPDLARALALCKNIADHMNSTLAITRSSEHLTMLGLGHFLEAHRRLVKEGALQVDSIKFCDQVKQKIVKKDYQFFLFNDLLVFMKVRKELKGNKDAQIKGSKIKQVWDKYKDTAWPLEIVWIRQLDEDKVIEIIGPMKTVTVRSKHIDVWIKAISENIQTVLETNDPETQPGAALRLSVRYGRYTHPSGETYEGDWDLGRMHGNGVSEFNNTYYEGEFELNIKNGEGKIEYADGQIYEGEFKSGKPHGLGTSCTRAGDKYVGEWVSGKRHGKGEMIMWNGDHYAGDWKDNHIEGIGTLNLQSLNISYTGEFAGGKFHGKGSLTNYLGTYTGDFEHGKQTGEGRMEYATHDIYEGLWKNGLRHGNGKMISQEGIYFGNWAKDFKEGKGKMEYCDGSMYDGAWLLGKRHGRGTWYNQIKPGLISAYSGDWLHDMREGYGELHYNTGDKWIGPIVAGQPHGHGKMVLSTGVTFDARFNNGIMEGKTDMLSDKGDIITIDSSNGQISGEPDGVEVLVPPFLPVLHLV